MFKLVCIQNEIKREKELYKKLNCVLQVLLTLNHTSIVI